MTTPSYKVFTAAGEYIAAIRYAEDAAAFVALQASGATVRFEHKLVIWREGAEAFSAAQSYDDAAATMRQRVTEAHQRGMERRRDAQERFAQEARS